MSIVLDPIVERAARALYDNTGARHDATIGWDGLPAIAKHHHREAALPIVAAIAPMLSAATLREAADHLSTLDPTETALSGADFPISVLRDLADATEREAAL